MERPFEKEHLMPFKVWMVAKLWGRIHYGFFQASLGVLEDILLVFLDF
jgi:hypothetical protein